MNVATATQGMWVSLCRVLGLDELAYHPDYRDNTARAKNRDALRERLNERFRTRDAIDWTRALIAAGIPAGPIYSLDRMFEDPQVIHSRLVEEVEHPLPGMIRQLASPIRMDALGGRSIPRPQIGRAPGRGRVCENVYISGVTR